MNEPPESHHFRWQSASIGRRILAALIDTGLCISPFVVLGLLLFDALHTPPGQCGIDACAMAAISIVAVLLFLIPAVPVAYGVVQIRGISPGMNRLSIRMVTAEGRSPGWRGVIRSVVALAFAAPLVFAGIRLVGTTSDGLSVRVTAIGAGVLVALIPYLWALWQPEHRTLHDLAAGTWVVSTARGPAGSTPAEEHWPGTM